MEIQLKVNFSFNFADIVQYYSLNKFLYAYTHTRCMHNKRNLHTHIRTNIFQNVLTTSWAQAQNKKPFSCILFLTNNIRERASRVVTCIILKQISNSGCPMVNNSLECNSSIVPAMGEDISSYIFLSRSVSMETVRVQLSFWLRK